MEFEERHGKRSRFSKKGSAHLQGGQDGSKWPKNKWGSFGFFSTTSTPYPR